MEEQTSEQLMRAAYPACEPRVGTDGRQEWQAARNELARRSLMALGNPSQNGLLGPENARLQKLGIDPYGPGFPYSKGAPSPKQEGE